jgi:hypothetical protein
VGPLALLIMTCGIRDVIGCWMMWQASRQRGTPGAAARPRDLSRLFVATLLRTGQSVDDRGVHDVRSAAAAWQLGLHDGAVCSEPVFRAGLFRDPGRLSLLNSASGAAIAAFGILGLMNV